MDKRIWGALHILFAVAIVAAVLWFSSDIGSLAQYGYAGAFAIALLSAATLFFPAPGWAAVIALGSVLNPVLLGFVAGVGSAIGELTGYVAGEGAREILNSRIKETTAIEGAVRRYGLGGIFVLAFIPNPLFDVAGIVAGSLKIPWWHYLLACAAGRVLRYVLLALLGNFTLGLIS